MRSLAGCRHDNAHAAPFGARSPLVHFSGLTVGARNLDFVGNAEFLKLLHAGFHIGHVALAAHDDSDQRLRFFSHENRLFHLAATLTH